MGEKKGFFSLSVFTNAPQNGEGDGGVYRFAERVFTGKREIGKKNEESSNF